MNKEEENNLVKYVKEKFKENDLDTDIVDIDEKLSYKQNLDIINTQIKDEINKREQEKIRERQQRELDLITADSEELEEIYKMPISMIEKVCDGKSKGLLLYGETSLGKSHKVKEVLKRKGKKPMDSKGEGDYLFVSGHITPMKFYEKLYECRDKIIVFDDCEILGNLIIINMIKAGLNTNSGNVVDYHTSSSKMTIPSSFEFSGQMLILLNKVPDSNEHLRAIASRIQNWELKFTREQIVKVIHLIAHKGNNEEFADTTEEERVMIAKWLTEATSLATTNLNIRLYLQAVSYYKWDRAYKLEKDWKALISTQIKNDIYATFLLQSVTPTAEEFTQEFGVSKSTYMRVKRRLGLVRGYSRLNITSINPKCQSVTNLEYEK